MVILRSGSTTESDPINLSEQTTSDQFGLFLIEACKSKEMQNMIRDIVAANQEDFRDFMSAEVHRQIMPLKEQLQHKDQEIHDLKRTVRDLEGKFDDLEQHGRRDSLRVSGIPEPELHHNTDIAVLKVCKVMKLDPP